MYFGVYPRLRPCWFISQVFPSRLKVPRLLIVNKRLPACSPLTLVLFPIGCSLLSASAAFCCELHLAHSMHWSSIWQHFLLPQYQPHVKVEGLLKVSRGRTRPVSDEVTSTPHPALQGAIHPQFTLQLNAAFQSVSWQLLTFSFQSGACSRWLLYMRSREKHPHWGGETWDSNSHAENHNSNSHAKQSSSSSLDFDSNVTLSAVCCNPRRMPL